jgi:hypothetical protein
VAVTAPRLAVTPVDGWDCTRSASVMDCTRHTFEPGKELSFLVVGGALGIPPGRYTMTADASASNESDPSDNHLETAWTVGRTWMVESEADSGPRSLRAAIEEANAVCTGDLPCVISFFVHGEIIPNPITLRSPLPVITACSFTLFSARRAPDIRDTPWGVEGSTLAAGEGLVFRPRCEDTSIAVDGFNIAGLPGDGIAILGPTRATYTLSRLQISGRSRGIAVDAPNATVTVKNSTIGNTSRSAITLWSARGTLVENVRIGVTEFGQRLPVGASGIFVGPAGGDLTVRNSLLASARDFGIALARGNATVVLENALITNNAAADIDWGLDGPSFDAGVPATPRVFSATYDGTRNITRVITEPLVQVWASTGLTLFSSAHLERFVGTADALGTVVFAGDLRGRYVSALRVERQRVSEVGGAVRVE